MKHRIKISVLFLLFCCNVMFSQSKEELKEFALRDAKITTKATLNFDFKTVLNHTYPGVVTLMGGEEKALGLLKTTFTQLTTNGFVFEKADVINVSEVIFEQDQYRCYIEGYNQMKISGKRIKSKSYLLGIYDSDNKKWWFIEAKQLKNSSLVTQVLPDFKTSLEIPDDEMQTEEL